MKSLSTNFELMEEACIPRDYLSLLVILLIQVDCLWIEVDNFPLKIFDQIEQRLDNRLDLGLVELHLLSAFDNCAERLEPFRNFLDF